MFHLKKITNKSLYFAFKLRFHENNDNSAIYPDLTELNSGGCLPKPAKSLYFTFQYLLYSILCIYKPLSTMGVTLYSQKQNRNQAAYLHFLFNQKASDFNSLCFTKNLHSKLRNAHD